MQSNKRLLAVIAMILFANNYCKAVGFAVLSIFICSCSDPPTIPDNNEHQTTRKQWTIQGQDTPLKGVWISLEGDAYAIGDKGIILHNDGNGWSVEDIGTSEAYLNDIWGFSNNDIYAVGDAGTIIHYNGMEWDFVTSPVPTTDLYAVWGSSNSAIFAVGENGTILLYDGSEWDQMPSVTSEDLRGIWGVSDNYIVAVGGNTALVFNGSSWSERKNGLPSTARLLDVWGSSEGNFYAVNSDYSNDPSVWHFSGTFWRNVHDFNVFYANTATIWGNAENDVFATVSYYTDIGEAYTVIKHYDGDDWTSIGTIKYLMINDIKGSSLYGILAVCDLGNIKYFNGTNWQNQIISSRSHLRSIWGISENNIYSVGDFGTILNNDGMQWMIIMKSDADVYDPDAYAIWGIADNNVFASFYNFSGDRGYVRQYNGTSWVIIRGENSEHYRGIWGSSPVNVLVVGHDNSGSGFILHYNGSQFEEFPGQFAPLYAIWGIGGECAYAVGKDGAIYSYNQPNWLLMQNDTYSNLHGIWGNSCNNMFAVGESSTIVHYNGSTWEPMEVPIHDIDLKGIWGYSSSDIYAAGENGTFLHYDGSKWISIESPVTNTLSSIWGSSNRSVLIVGSNGTILHYEP
jgi:hypothetical protein